jgi:hypothetical protein
MPFRRDAESKSSFILPTLSMSDRSRNPICPSALLPNASSCVRSGAHHRRDDVLDRRSGTKFALAQPPGRVVGEWQSTAPAACDDRAFVHVSGPPAPTPAQVRWAATRPPVAPKSGTSSCDRARAMMKRQPSKHWRTRPQSSPPPSVSRIPGLSNRSCGRRKSAPQTRRRLGPAGATTLSC